MELRGKSGFDLLNHCQNLKNLVMMNFTGHGEFKYDNDASVCKYKSYNANKRYLETLQ